MESRGVMRMREGNGRADGARRELSLAASAMRDELTPWMTRTIMVSR